MLKLRIPLTIAMLAHLAIFASLSGVLPKGSFNDFTPVEVIELAKEEPARAKTAPVQKIIEPTKERKRIQAPVLAEPQKTVKAIDEAKPVPLKENVRQSQGEIIKDEEPPFLKEAEREKSASETFVNKIAEPVSRDRVQGEFEFRSYVRQRIEKAKFYPAWARQRGYEGTVGIRFNILPDGRVEDVRVVRPCHCDILNKAACEAVEKAAPFDRQSKIDSKVIAMDVDLGFRLK